MKKLFYFFLAISLLHQITGAQWIIQPSPVGSSLLDVEFINRNTGWACGDGGIIVKTTNSGVNWFQQTSGVSNKTLNGIHPVDSNIVYCVGWFQTILKTTNGGLNWQILRNGTFGNDPSFFEVFFLDQNTGWMIRNFCILRTTNGGLTFDSTNVIFSYMRDIYFKDPINGVLCGDGALIMKTTDGGISWVQINIPRFNFSQPDFYKESFIGNTGWVVARTNNYSLNQFGHLTWKTTDFGATWDTISRLYPDDPFNYENYCVNFSSLNTGWCGGTTGKIFKTTNGGFNWIQQQVPSVNFRRSIWFYNDSIGWAVGGAGQIVHTTSGGQYLKLEQISSEIPSDFKLYQNYPNPFNPVTKIKFLLPLNHGDKERVIFKIYDMLGKEITTLVNEELKPGEYEIIWDASAYPSGIYIYKLIYGSHLQSKKMILIK